MDSTQAIRQQIDKQLDELDGEQLTLILRYAETLHSLSLPAAYDPESDPSVGFFAADPDLGARTQEILRAEFGVRKPQQQDDTP